MESSRASSQLPSNSKYTNTQLKGILLLLMVSAIGLYTTYIQSCAIQNELDDKKSFVYDNIHKSSSINVPYSDMNSGVNRRVVIAAGPHKTGTLNTCNFTLFTPHQPQCIIIIFFHPPLHDFGSIGSTSIQNNFHKWTEADQYLLKNWAWPVPNIVSKYESQDENNWKWNPSKGFYALAELLRGNSHKITDRLVFRNVDRESLVLSYRMEFLRAWTAGYNLIIGTEAFDNIVKDDDGDEMIDRLINLMPWNYDIDPNNDNQKYQDAQKEKITVVVTYRTPRVKHLLSIWRETKKKNESFKAWMLSTKNNFGAIDSLALAEKFLNKDMNVVLADMNGITNAGYDISNIIACQVLDAACTDQQQVEGSDPPLIMNTKQNFNGDIDIDEDKLELMDEVMRKYDCKYIKLLKLAKLRLLYPTELKNVLKSCDKSSKAGMSRGSMKEQLVCIAKGNNDCLMK